MKNFVKHKAIGISAVLILIAIVFSGIYATKNICKISLKGTAVRSHGSDYGVEGKNIAEFNPAIKINESKLSNEKYAYDTEKVIRHSEISIKIVEKDDIMTIFNEINSSVKSFNGYVKDADYSENKNGAQDTLSCLSLPKN